MEIVRLSALMHRYRKLIAVLVPSTTLAGSASLSAQIDKGSALFLKVAQKVASVANEEIPDYRIPFYRAPGSMKSL